MRKWNNRNGGWLLQGSAAQVVGLRRTTKRNPKALGFGQSKYAYGFKGVVPLFVSQDRYTLMKQNIRGDGTKETKQNHKKRRQAKWVCLTRFKGKGMKCCVSQLLQQRQESFSILKGLHALTLSLKSPSLSFLDAHGCLGKARMNTKKKLRWSSSSFVTSNAHT